jgi:hypothetical protein
MKKQSLRISTIAIPMMIVCGLLALGPSARAEPGDEDGACSNRTLRGDYGFAAEGLILPAPGVVIPLRGVHMTHFDGKGTLTQMDSFVANGSPISDWTPVSGTYHINANCTGTMHLEPSTGGFVNLRIVVVRQGKEVHTVVWPPFDVPNGYARTVTSVGIKVE